MYFFQKVFPEYASHEFYVSGESYGGVYVPTLSYNLITLIEAGILQLNFKVSRTGGRQRYGV
jgi:carboxypeptidase C (cathepsin A)